MNVTMPTKDDLKGWRRGQRLWLKQRRSAPDPDGLCYVCTKKKEHRYLVTLPGYLFAYDPPYENAPTEVNVCADCLRTLCSLLTDWLLEKCPKRPDVPR